MSGQGHPDWQRLSQWIGDPFLIGEAATIGFGGQSWGPFYMGEWQSVELQADFANAAARRPFVRLRFWADQAMTQLIETLDYWTQSSAPIRDVASAAGPWLQVIASEFTVGGYDIVLTVIPRAASSRVPQVNNGPIMLGTQLVVPNGTSTFPQLSIVTGAPCYIGVNSTGVDWHCRVEALNSVGGWIAIGSVPSDPSRRVASTRICLPTTLVRLRYANTSATNQTVNFGATLGES